MGALDGVLCVELGLVHLLLLPLRVLPYSMVMMMLGRDGLL